MEFTTTNITLIVVGSLTWLVFVLGMAKFSKYYLQFVGYRKELDTNLTGMGSGMKKLQNSIAEMILEQRRTNKLLLELIDKDKAVEDYQTPETPEIEYQIPEKQEVAYQEPEVEFVYSHENEQD
jgi:hypothetical protein